MNLEFAVLRLLHIIFGVIWVGSAFFMTVILEPKLRALGPAVQRPVMKAIFPTFIAIVVPSATITIIAGIILVFRLLSGSLSSFFDTGWGWAILIGFVTAMTGYILSLGFVIPAARRMISMGDSMEGRPPTQEEIQQIQGLSGRLRLYSRIALVALIIALGSMATARFV
jgi:uncharacterized membrane protein